MFTDHPKTLDDENGSRLVGEDATGDVQYYDPVQQRIAPMRGGSVDWDAGRDVRESLGETIEDIGDTVGWEGLSSFANEHVEPSEE